MTNASVFQNAHFNVEAIADGSVLRVVRTPAAFADREDLDQSWGALNDALDAAGRATHALLVDTRQAPGRNDPSFEEAFRGHRQRMLAGFARGAVVVKSQAGRLQVERHAREDAVEIGVFLNEEEAIAHLCAS